MVVCGACLTESADGSRFCPSCGRPLAAPTLAPPFQTGRARARLEERKVVSVLFCDLVGFTAMSETADPEDVDRVLDAYGGMARSAIVAHGGVVEKFIGDAVVGVFGVPATHEDDALRAVRAGLAICDGADRLRAIGGSTLRLRVGVNTGEALVRLDVAPDAGERFMTGDAINTAARIQSVAPEQGVAVGETTWHATRPAVDYVELPPATLKGKAEPVRVFHAMGLRTTIGIDPSRSHSGVHVGRAAELGRLRTLFDRAALDGRGGLVLVVGEPGIGKSRLVKEFRRHVQAVAPLVTWRQGRCLPYGDGVTFWALGEIVKAHAGILDGDDPAVATAKLEAVLAADAERVWLRTRLLPLVGVEGPSTPSREEAFAAWRRFLHGLAATRPAVVVIEDLHWADDALQDFVADLATHLDQIPLLVVGTARPELFARRATLRTVAADDRIDLTPLSDAETAEFVANVLGVPVPKDICDAILQRADGNPLFAEEYARLLDDRGLLVVSDGAVVVRAGASLPVPESIGALLAARLDTLPRSRKAVLADASVVGQVFWAGTVAAMGDRDRGMVLEDLADLQRLEFVRRVEPSSMDGEDESAFWHALGRDVAYAQLPRAARSVRHLAAAAWLEAKAGDRVEDIAEVLAHHYTTALELAEATGDESLADAVRPTAARLLRLSGDRALGLDTAIALAAYERALPLMEDHDPERGPALRRVGTARLQAGEYERSVDAYREALGLFEAAGDEHAAALTKIDLARALQWIGPPHWELQEEAAATLESEGPSADLVHALGMMAFVHLVSDRPAESIATADRAIELAASLGLPAPASAYAWRGSTRCLLGDPAGLDDGRTAIELATRAGLTRDAAMFRNEYTANVAVFLGGREAETAGNDLLAFAASRGLSGIERLARASLAEVMLDQGRLDEAEPVIRVSLEEFAAAGDVTMVTAVHASLARIASLRGDPATALAQADLIEADPHLRDNASWPLFVAMAARVRAEASDRDGAARLLVALQQADGGSVYRGFEIRDAVVAALAIGDLDLARRIVEGSADPRPLAAENRRLARALVAEAEENLESAAEGFKAAAGPLEALSLPEHTQALLGYGRVLMKLGRPAQAEATLRQARDLAQRMGAAPWLAEADGLLAAIAGQTSKTEAPAGSESARMP